MDDKPDAAAIEFIRLPEVKRLTGLSTATIYRLAKDGKFPGQIKIGEQAVAWIKSEVLAWSIEKIKATRRPHEGS
ncbi:helix-turn-helix transcriptional regulator [Pseudomonas sp. PS02290]|uniref:helix-turn-helix transcriptional regulator n=1 Tax=Pseudomonas sp. PS02290 TaxID=2991430 RepID=UPI00249BD3AB|nr:AlpA family transcriptional regulator [Pseudomonas sp. PS02290]